jgi:hypothetical protein
MKKIILLSLLSTVLISCEEILGSKVEAEFRIIDWTQEFYISLQEWGPVEIQYEIENTGDVTIDCYVVYFDARCIDLSVYSDCHAGSDVKPGETYACSTLVDTAGNEAVSVSISDYELEIY